MKNGKDECKYVCCHVSLGRLGPQRRSVTISITNGDGSQIATKIVTRLFAKWTGVRDCASQRRKEMIASARYEHNGNTSGESSHMPFCNVEDHFNPSKMLGIENCSTNTRKALRNGREDANSTATHNCIACFMRTPPSPIPRDCGPRHMDKNTRNPTLARTFAIRSHICQRTSSYRHESIRWIQMARASCPPTCKHGFETKIDKGHFAMQCLGTSSILMPNLQCYGKQRNYVKNAIANKATKYIEQNARKLVADESTHSRDKIVGPSVHG